MVYYPMGSSGCHSSGLDISATSFQSTPAASPVDSEDILSIHSSSDLLLSCLLPPPTMYCKPLRAKPLLPGAEMRKVFLQSLDPLGLTYKSVLFHFSSESPILQRTRMFCEPQASSGLWSCPGLFAFRPPPPHPHPHSHPLLPILPPNQ